MIEQIHVYSNKVNAAAFCCTMNNGLETATAQQNCVEILSPVYFSVESSELFSDLTVKLHSWNKILTFKGFFNLVTILT